MQKTNFYEILQLHMQTPEVDTPEASWRVLDPLESSDYDMGGQGGRQLSTTAA